MSDLLFQIFVSVSLGAIALMVRSHSRSMFIKLNQMDKRMEATELRMMKLDQTLDKWGAHFDKRCDDMDYDLREINRMVSDVNLRFAILEARAEERTKMITAQPAIAAKRPYRRRQQNGQKEE